ncbi:hypothetical protein PISMIDRAFT_649627 [Pisolithus microcarpus 441]|uniref:Uncharacterized protein n=1 Tax=Pisolithus microcarpus 441 TaxID=765257 RepID=A0A0C9YDZ3_9AGAM|nr:hypothetical protein BKA83DRAFT_649627 [Pisolithus microcarpus]KIK12024.1 hypothetical protein PISMIDRAFT_649627 [Pisolithus microcarpus 441]
MVQFGVITVGSEIYGYQKEFKEAVVTNLTLMSTSTPVIVIDGGWQRKLSLAGGSSATGVGRQWQEKDLEWLDQLGPITDANVYQVCGRGKMEKRESGLPETRWYIDLPTKDIAANEEQRDKYNAIEDPEMVNQEVGITGIAMQDTEYPPITDYLLTSR